MNESLQQFLIKSHDSSIYALARYADRCISASWESVFEEHLEELIDLYIKFGDSAYGVYCKLLFERLHAQLKNAGYRPRPRLPGNFSLSREWGTQHDRQRWFWSAISSAKGEAMGTIVIVFYHDHTELRLPRAPQVLPLEELTNDAVISALSERFVDFRNAPEARVEIAEEIQCYALEQPRV